MSFLARLFSCHKESTKPFYIPSSNQPNFLSGTFKLQQKGGEPFLRLQEAFGEHSGTSWVTLTTSRKFCTYQTALWPEGLVLCADAKVRGPLHGVISGLPQLGEGFCGQLQNGELGIRGQRAPCFQCRALALISSVLIGCTASILATTC